MKKLISFWKQVREKSSDMFTLFRVGIGVKVPTHKLHLKDKADPLKIEGLQNDATDPDKYLTIDSSNIVKYRTGTEVASDIGVVSSFILEDGDGTEVTITNGSEIKFVEGSGIDINWTDTSDGSDTDPYDITFTVDHDAATNFVAAEHVDWAASGAGTIHTDNYIENVVQTTVTGSSGTVTSIGNLTGDVTSSNRATTIASGAVHHGMLNDDIISGQSANLVPQQDDALLIHDTSAGTVNKIAFTDFEDEIFGNVSGDATVVAGGALTLGGTQASITTCANLTTVGTIGTGVWEGTTIKTAYIGDDQVTEDKLDNTLLAEIDANTAKVTFPNGITYSSEVLTIGDDDNGTATITRKTHGDEAGGKLAVQAGDATGTNKAGGGLILEAGRGTGSAAGGAISFYSSAAGGSSTTLRSNVEIAAFDNVGNLQIDGDLTVTGNDIKDSGGNSIISSNGSGVVTMAGGNILVGGSNANLEMNAGSDIILEADNAGGGLASSIQYNSSTGNKIMLGATSDVVVLCNRTLNGTVEIRANAAAGSGGEVTVATFEDDKVTISQDLDVAGNVLPGITYIKILPSDFIADDGGRPLAIDDTSSDRWLESHGTNPMYASIEIPIGFKATHVDIYGSATSAITVYEADVNSRSVTSKGTGNIGTQINITDVTADSTNYLLIEMAQASGEQVNGGKVTIAKA